MPRGTYRNMLVVGDYDSPITLAAVPTIAPDHILLDFGGTAPCAPMGINVPHNYATAYAVFALRCIIGPNIPNTAGSLEPFRVTAPKGPNLSPCSIRGGK